MSASPSAYTCRISEAQRQLIVAALERCPDLSSGHARQQSSTSLERENLTLLLDVLRELPAVEMENPGTLHGLCL